MHGPGFQGICIFMLFAAEKLFRFHIIRERDVSFELCFKTPPPEAKKPLKISIIFLLHITEMVIFI